jgi:hypothetical protein
MLRVGLYMFIKIQAQVDQILNLFYFRVNSMLNILVYF